MSSRYALVLVEKKSGEDDQCRLMKTVYSDETVRLERADFGTVQEMIEALKTVRADGVNTWFYENGTFEYDHIQGVWIWSCMEEKLRAPMEPLNYTYYSD